MFKLFKKLHTYLLVAESDILKPGHYWANNGKTIYQMPIEIKTKLTLGKGGRNVKCVNGWTKKSMIEHIKKEFKGKSLRNPGKSDKFCAYRGNNNTKCAVGMFIPDDVYTVEMEGKNITTLDVGIYKYMPLDIEEMLMLQRKHDNSYEDKTLIDMLNWIEKNVEE